MQINVYWSKPQKNINCGDINRRFKPNLQKYSVEDNSGTKHSSKSSKQNLNTRVP